MHTMGSRLKNVMEKFHLRGNSASKQCIQDEIILTPRQAIMMHLHITCKAEFSCANCFVKGKSS